MVKSISIDDLQNIKDYLFRCNGLYDGQFDLDIQQAILVEVYIDSVKQSLKKPGFIALMCQAGGEVTGLLVAQLLEWDSSHFSIKTHRLSYMYAENEYFTNLLLESYIDLSKKNANGFITCRIPAHNETVANVLAQSGFKLLLHKVLLRCNLLEHHSIGKPGSACLIRHFTDTDGNTVRKLAADSIEINRFYKDPNIPKELIPGIYSSWLDNLIHTQPQSIIVAEKEGVVVGFVTYSNIASAINKKKGGELKFGFIDIIAVDKQHRGIGRYLLDEAKERMKNDHYKVVYANTALQNISSMMMFQKSGFYLFAAVSEYSLHLSSDFK